MRRVGRKIVFQTLFVADVDENIVENAGAGIFAGRNGQTALEHVLEQSDGFEADGFTTGVGAGNEEQAGTVAERDVERIHLLPVALETLLEQRVASLHPVDARIGLQARHDAGELLGEDGEGAEVVNVRKKLHRVENVLDVGTDLGGEDLQDADDLAAFCSFEFANAVVGVDNGGRFDEDSLTRSTFVVDDTLDLALESRGYGNDEATVAERGGDIAIDVAFCLRFVDDGAQGVADAARSDLDGVANVEQLGRGGILDFAVLVEDAVDASNELGEAAHAVGHAGEGGVERCGTGGRRRVGGRIGLCFLVGDLLLLRGTEEAHEAYHGLEGALEVEEIELFEVSAFGTNAHKGLAHVVEVFFVDVFLGRHEAGEFLGLCQRFAYGVEVGRKSDVVVDPFGPQTRHAAPLEEGAHFGETNFAFEIIGIDHEWLLLFEGKGTQYSAHDKIYRRRVGGRSGRVRAQIWVVGEQGFMSFLYLCNHRTPLFRARL